MKANACQLSPRQLDVLRLLCAEETTKSIALLLKVSVKTVEYYRKQIYLRLCVNNPLAMFKAALRLGIVTLQTDYRCQQFPGFKSAPVRKGENGSVR